MPATPARISPAPADQREATAAADRLVKLKSRFEADRLVEVTQWKVQTY